MNEELRKQLATVASAIHFAVEYELDSHCSWDGDGPSPRERGFSPYDVTVSATVIVNGEMLTGQAHLGNCWEKPGKFDPDIHGYLPQMIDEALDDLSEAIGNTVDKSLCEMNAHFNIGDAQRFIDAHMRMEYEKQRKELNV